MSLYIKGLKMPKKGRYTSFTIYDDGRVVFKFGGDPAGKAIELPPHGDLIDRDKLLRIWAKDKEDLHNKGIEYCDNSWDCVFAGFERDAECIAVIVPREEGTE